VFPAHLVSIQQAVQAGDAQRARREWDRLYPLMNAIMSAPFIPAVKSALTALGVPIGGPRRPLLDLDPATAATIAALATALPHLSDAQ
jgi:4-hydroxy-tetrahydrodipicolinate synthase